MQFLVRKNHQQVYRSLPRGKVQLDADNRRSTRLHGLDTSACHNAQHRLVLHFWSTLSLCEMAVFLDKSFMC